MPIPIFEVVGVTGVTLILLAYFLIQIEKLSPKQLMYQLLNGLGAIGVIYSLCFRFNLSAFIIEVAWLLISIFGVVKILMRKPATVPPTSEGQRTG